jgi:anti-sigma factor RsiW
MIGGIMLALLLTVPEAAAVHEAQIAATRESLRGVTGYVCVAIDPGILMTPAARDAHLRSAQARVDPPAPVLARLTKAGTTIFPSSQCVRTDREWDIVHRPTGKPALRVGVGRVELLSSRRARVVVFTYAGVLSDTFTQLELELQKGVWTVVSSATILQA